MAALSERQREHITTALEQAGATLPCPRCGHAHFELFDGYVVEYRQTQLRDMVVGGDNRVPTVVMSCRRCGYVAQHVLSALDVPTNL